MRKLGRIIIFVFIMMTAVPFANAGEVVMGNFQLEASHENYVKIAILGGYIEWDFQVAFTGSGCEFFTSPAILQSSGKVGYNSGEVSEDSLTVIFGEEEVFSGNVTGVWPWIDDYHLFELFGFPFPLPEWGEGHGYVNIEHETYGSIVLNIDLLRAEDLSAELEGFSLKYKCTSLDGHIVLADSSVAPEPEIELIGDNPLTHTWGNVFVDPGARVAELNTWNSNCFTIDVQGLDELDVNTPGEYILTYTAVGTDAAGNPANPNTITRTVKITDDGPVPAGGGDGDGGDGGGGGGGGGGDCFISAVR